MSWIYAVILALFVADAPQVTLGVQGPSPKANAPANANAQANAKILGDEARPKKRLRVEQVRARMTFFDQYGRGYQSKAGPPEGPGNERLLVFQPMMSLDVRQRDERFAHRATMVVDIVSSASADALDAVSQASRENEAVTLDFTSSFQPSARDTWSLRYGVHLEEPWRSALAGFGYSGNFNADNTTVNSSLNFVYDYFDDLYPRGWNTTQTERYALNSNFSVSQVLSPTTLATVSLGATFQIGSLQNGWNSVYVSDAETYGCFDDPSQLAAYDCLNRRRDKFPRTRFRQAIATQLNQHIKRTRSTFKLHYRYYRDDFNLTGHTAGIKGYQWVHRRAYLRLAYRYHHQTGVDFFRTSVLSAAPMDTFLTADSDLAPLSAHQLSAKAVVYLTPPNAAKGLQSVDISFTRYQRSNSLRINIFSVGYAKAF